MQNASNFLRLVLSELEPRDWSPACTAFLLALRRADYPRDPIPEDERRAIFELFERVIGARALRDDPTGREALELINHRLGPKSELSCLPSELSKFPQASVAIPARAGRNAAFAVCSPREARQALDIQADDPSLEALARTVEEYDRDLQKNNVTTLRGPQKRATTGIVCAVQPYIDTILATLAMYLVSDIASTQIEFKAVDWIEIPEQAKKLVIDISYGSRYAFDESRFEFKATKQKVTRIPCVSNIFHQETRSISPPYISTMPAALNFVGYYTPTSSRFGKQLVRLKLGQESVDVTAFPVASVHDFEANALLALAAGVLPVSYMILTNAGFLWAAEAGLLYRDFGDGLQLGALECGEVLAEDSQDDVVGFAVRRSQARAVSQGLVHRLTNVVERIDRSLDTARENAEEAARLLSALKGPIVQAYQYDSGILARLSPYLAVEMTRSRGKYFEGEVDYRPAWWDTLSAALKSTATPRVVAEGVAE